MKKNKNSKKSSIEKILPLWSESEELGLLLEKSNSLSQSVKDDVKNHLKSFLDFRQNRYLENKQNLNRSIIGNLLKYFENRNIRQISDLNLLRQLVSGKFSNMGEIILEVIQ